jgi:flagellar biosynthesis regulator FlbT
VQRALINEAREDIQSEFYKVMATLLLFYTDMEIKQLLKLIRENFKWTKFKKELEWLIALYNVK